MEIQKFLKDSWHHNNNVTKRCTSCPNLNTIANPWLPLREYKVFSESGDQFILTSPEPEEEAFVEFIPKGEPTVRDVKICQSEVTT